MVGEHSVTVAEFNLRVMNFVFHLQCASSQDIAEQEDCFHRYHQYKRPRGVSNKISAPPPPDISKVVFWGYLLGFG